MTTLTEISLILAFLFLPFLAGQLCAEETVYPEGYNFICQYEPSDTIAALSDTLLLTRSLVNDETFPANGLYFSENIPPAFTIVSYSIRINGEDIEYLFQEESDSPVIGGCVTYYWVVDEPGSLSTVKNDVNPGDCVDLEMKLTCASAGEFIFPLHTTVFYAGGSGFFSTGGQQTVLIEASALCGDADADGRINILDTSYLVNFLYRSGPPPDPLEVGDTDSSGSINILDITRILGYLYKGGPEPVCPLD
jgi:uncharacterized repeat protein (TIGR01451 family)